MGAVPGLGPRASRRVAEPHRDTPVTISSAMRVAVVVGSQRPPVVLYRLFAPETAGCTRCEDNFVAQLIKE